MIPLKNIYIHTFYLAIFSIVSTTSYGQTLHWVKQMGSTGWDEGTSIAVDGKGNVYTTGNFKETVDFDPDIASTFNLTAICEYGDIFISKLDSLGNFVWAKQFGGTGFQESNAITIDSSGNIYTTGSFIGQVDFDPGAGTFNLTSSGGDRDIFIQKIDVAGNFIWAKQISGISSISPTDAFSIAVDATGNVYTTGYFDGTTDFDPDPVSTFNLTVIAYSDIFISKLDSLGNFVWAKQLGGTEGGVGYSIAIDGNGNVYSTGTIGATATVDFDPGPVTFYLTSSDPINSGSYISKLDSSGIFV